MSGPAFLGRVPLRADALGQMRRGVSVPRDRFLRRLDFFPYPSYIPPAQTTLVCRRQPSGTADGEETFVCVEQPAAYPYAPFYF